MEAKATGDIPDAFSKRKLFLVLLVFVGLLVFWELNWSSAATEASPNRFHTVFKSQDEVRSEDVLTSATESLAEVSTSSSKNFVRGTDVWLKTPKKLSNSQLWDITTNGPSGSQIRLSSRPELCISYYGAYTVETLHLWHCTCSESTSFVFDEMKKTLSPIKSPEKCITAQVDAPLILAPCDGRSSQTFRFPLNLKKAVIENLENKTLVFEAQPSFMESSAFIGFFVAKVVHPDVYERLNGTVLISSHKDGAVLRATLKRLPADGLYDLLMTSTDCSHIYENITLASQEVVSMDTTSRCAAALAYTPLSGPLRSVALRSGSTIIACASLTPVAKAQIGHETRSYELAMKISTRFAPGASNVWAALSGEKERLFQIIREDAVRWLPEAVKALEIASKTKIVFGLVCKNVAANMPPTLTACEESGKRFKDYRVIILENNSGDSTGAIVKDWAARNDKVKGISETIPGDFPREVNIANARNRALKIYLTPEYDDFPYFMFVDCDFPYGWPAESVALNFVRDDWAAVCSNGVAGDPPHLYYWDRYAYRDARWPFGPNDRGWLYLAEPRMKMLYDAGEDWVPVSISCFGGFAVYRRSAIAPCNGAYSGYDSKGRVDVEHAPFSQCILRNGGLLFMNPSAFLRYPVTMYFP